MQTTFIKSISINADKTHPFPFNIPAVKFCRHLQLDNSVTIFVGDNGCGKSTLLETIAMKLNLPLIGGHIKGSDGFEAAGILNPYLRIAFINETPRGFFFRAEDFSHFIYQAQRGKEAAEGGIADLRNVVDEYTFNKMSESANYQLRQMRKDYGADMQAFSHGEAYLTILQTRIAGKGIYLLDEPEAALSPLKQLSLISFILETIKNSKAQFIIATHSPLLMGIPGACIYEITESGINSVAFEETEHYRITKSFLDNPKQYLRYL